MRTAGAKRKPPLAGLTAEERTRRAVAVILAESEWRSASSRQGAPFTALVEALPEPEPDPAEVVGLAEAAAEPSPVNPRFPDRPVVTITIGGAAGSGKSVIAHVIRHLLAREGIAAEGPAGLRTLPWRRALDRLVWRGLTVELRREGEP